VIPGYWQNEVGGELAAAIGRYLRGELLGAGELELVRRYLAQWIAGDWRGPAIGALRLRVTGLRSTADLDAWLADAVAAGIDPL
jgi:hypothetical protein